MRIDITLAPLTQGDMEQFILDNQEAFRYCLMYKHDSCCLVQGKMSREECMLGG